MKGSVAMTEEHIQEKIEKAECPECGGVLKDVWDTVSNDPPHSEHIMYQCTECGWEG